MNRCCYIDNTTWVHCEKPATVGFYRPFMPYDDSYACDEHKDTLKLMMPDHYCMRIDHVEKYPYQLPG